MATQIAALLQVMALVLVLGGEKVFQFMGVATPQWYGFVAENKLMTFGMVWMLNNFAAQMVATGAFEIYLDDHVVFSKLETGRLPTIPELVSGLEGRGLKSS